MHVAVDGAEAVVAPSNHAFDLIVMDFQMARTDSFASARAIRALSGGAFRAPIVGLGAHSLSKVEGQDPDAGTNDCLVKPVAPAILRSIAAKWAGANMKT